MYTHCDLCQKPINYGEQHHTLVLHKERANLENGDVYITVDDAEELLTSCISCIQDFHKEAVSKVLAAETPGKAKMLGELCIPIKIN